MTISSRNTARTPNPFTGWTTATLWATWLAAATRPSTCGIRCPAVSQSAQSSGPRAFCLGFKVLEKWDPLFEAEKFLNQSFYKQLPDVCSSSLKSLHIAESPILTWNFIGQFKQVISITRSRTVSPAGQIFSGQVSDLRSLLNLIKNRKPFYLNFVFKPRKCIISIETESV